MSKQQDFLEFGKSKLNQWKSIIEELEVQMALGKAEAKDVLKREKKNFSKFFNQQKSKLKKAEKSIEEHRILLMQKINELEGTVSSSKPKTKRAFSDKRRKILKTIYELEYVIKLVYAECAEKLRSQFDKLKEDLDNYRIQLALIEFEKRGNLKSYETALLEELEATRIMLDASNGKSIESFMEEISESFGHLKKAFSEIL